MLYIGSLNIDKSILIGYDSSLFKILTELLSFNTTLQKCLINKEDVWLLLEDLHLLKISMEKKILRQLEQRIKPTEGFIDTILDQEVRLNIKLDEDDSNIKRLNTLSKFITSSIIKENNKILFTDISNLKSLPESSLVLSIIKIKGNGVNTNDIISAYNNLEKKIDLIRPKIDQEYLYDILNNLISKDILICNLNLNGTKNIFLTDKGQILGKSS